MALFKATLHDFALDRFFVLSRVAGTYIGCIYFVFILLVAKKESTTLRPWQSIFIQRTYAHHLHRLHEQKMLNENSSIRNSPHFPVHS